MAAHGSLGKERTRIVNRLFHVFGGFWLSSAM